MTVTEWQKRSLMKQWRRRSYRDPSLKWTKKVGIDVIRIIGHFVWHAKKPLEYVSKKIKAWLTWWTSGDVPIPEGGKALAQFLFITLNAFITGKGV